MKLLVLGDRARYEANDPVQSDFYRETEIAYLEPQPMIDALPDWALDAELIAIDPMCGLSGSVIRRMPALRMIHSEGVGYERIDLAAATERGVMVCNNRGVNAKAVAEQAVYLMLGVLRHALEGDTAVRDGEQMEAKEYWMHEGISELGECTVGLIGFGAIAKETARLLNAFGCRLLYTSAHRKAPEEEAAYHVEWVTPERLLRESRMVSLHVPVTDETRGMVNDGFLSMMRRDAFLINTARGDLVDNDALGRACLEGTIAGAGLDTIAPEPVSPDNPLLQLPWDAQKKILFSPHIGGVTSGVLKRAHRGLWRDFEALARGGVPDNLVNPECLEHLSSNDH